jgi:hypothetical protein
MRKEYMKTKYIASALILSSFLLSTFGDGNRRFEVSEDGTVKDHTTGLMWLQNPNQFEEMNWHEGNEICEQLEVGNYSDWRLPAVQELVALAEQSKKNEEFTKGQPFKINLSKNTFANRAIYWCESINETHAAAASPIDGWSFRGRYKGWPKGEKTKYPDQQGYVWPVRKFK